MLRASVQTPNSGYHAHDSNSAPEHRARVIPLAPVIYWKTVHLPFIRCSRFLSIALIRCAPPLAVLKSNLKRDWTARRNDSATVSWGPFQRTTSSLAAFSWFNIRWVPKTSFRMLDMLSTTLSTGNISHSLLTTSIYDRRSGLPSRSPHISFRRLWLVVTPSQVCERSTVKASSTELSDTTQLWGMRPDRASACMLLITSPTWSCSALLLSLRCTRSQGRRHRFWIAGDADPWQ